MQNNSSNVDDANKLIELAEMYLDPDNKWKQTSCLEAEKYLRKAIELGSDKAAIFLATLLLSDFKEFKNDRKKRQEAAHILISLEKTYGVASNLIKEYTKRDDNNILDTLLFAKEYADVNNNDAAENILNNILSNDDRINSEKFIILSKIYLNKKMYDNSILAANEANRLGNNKSLLYLGITYFCKNESNEDLKKSEEFLNESKKYYPEESYYYLGRIYELYNDYDVSITYYEKVNNNYKDTDNRKRKIKQLMWDSIPCRMTDIPDAGNGNDANN